MSASEVRKILDEIAVEVGIQKTDEWTNRNKCHYVFYQMSGSISYFMNFTWYDSGSWHIDVADSIEITDNLEIFTTGNMTIYPRGFDVYTVNIIKDQLNELITNYNKVRKEMKLKEILNARGKYDV